MIAHPITQPVQAWQWNGQHSAAWPFWVRTSCVLIEYELFHDRQSGRQVVNQGEWLVRDLDGEVNFYTPEEFGREFAAHAPS